MRGEEGDEKGEIKMRKDEGMRGGRMSNMTYEEAGRIGGRRRGRRV